MPPRTLPSRAQRLKKHVALGLVSLMLAGCAGKPAQSLLSIDDTINAVGQSSRVRYVVLHYTSVDTATSLEILSKQKVSAHYLITNDAAPRIYRLVSEDKTAWHAGESRWFDQPSLNSLSIGIELVNGGRYDEPSGSTRWAPYSATQISALSLLLKDLITRHNISPENIVGHSDIAPQRKTDPGPLFPWKTLAAAGIGRWHSETLAASYEATLQLKPLPSINWFQEQLKKLGYTSPTHGKLDRATKNVIAAFQMHYRPSNYSGQPDIETASIMMALLTSQH